MKMADAIALINANVGYRVMFEVRNHGMLESDFFPAAAEAPIADLEDAWKLAREFAATDPQGARFVNVYVIQARDFSPVADYQAKKLNAYPLYAERVRA